MTMEQVPVFVRSAALLFVLLNPFLLILYLTDVVQKLPPGRFAGVLLRASVISSVVFTLFALLGDLIFSDVIQADFASFQIFGGIVFLIIGVRFVFQGTSTIESLRGESQHIAGAIAMPVMIGPGTISASVLIGKRLSQIQAIGAILSAVLLSVLIIIALKMLHDYVKSHNASLIGRYTEVAGRIMALYVGTVAVDMIMQGVQTWVAKM